MSCPGSGVCLTQGLPQLIEPRLPLSRCVPRVVPKASCCTGRWPDPRVARTAHVPVTSAKPGPTSRELCSFPLVADGRGPRSPSENHALTSRDKVQGFGEYSEGISLGFRLLPHETVISYLAFLGRSSLWIKLGLCLFHG